MTDPRPPSEPFFVAHVARDASPETLEALADLAAAAIRHLEATPPGTVQITDRGKHHRQVSGTRRTFCGRIIGPAAYRYAAGIATGGMLCQDCMKEIRRRESR